MSNWFHGFYTSNVDLWKLTIPISFIFLIYFLLPREVYSSRLLCLLTSLIALCWGIRICHLFNTASFGFQFTTSIDLFWFDNLKISMGVDGISLIFTILTLFIFPICFVAAWPLKKESHTILICLLAIEVILLFTFITTDLLYFYVFFESLLIPMFILIGCYGARERKIKASYLFFLYTLFGSLIMLLGVIYLYAITGSTSYLVLMHINLDEDQQRVVWLCFFMAFAIKMPLFPFHIWLPEAHVEAPTIGSMLLASLLLKLGGYGFLRFSISILHAGAEYYGPIVSALALLGVIYGSLSTIRQTDLKRVIAYSSVAHINLVILGLFSFNKQGIEGAIYLIVAHGVVSAALFFCVGVVYDRYHSRLLKYYGGLAVIMPLFSFFFFSFTLANIGFPGTSNFLGELLLFLGVFEKSSAVLLFVVISVVLSAVYSIWLFNRVCFGALKTTYIKIFTDINYREFVILAILFISIVTLGITANFILDYTHVIIENILKK